MTQKLTRRHRLVAAMIGVSATVYMERTAVSITAPQMIRDLGISETQMGSVFSVFYLAYTGCMFLGGRLSDRFGPRRTLTAGVLGAALCTVLTAACGTASGLLIGAAFACLIAVRFAAGACAAPLYPACARLTANWFPASKTARVQALLFGATILGMAIVPVVLTPVIRSFGWQSAFYGMAACLTVALFVWRRWVRDLPPDGRSIVEGGSAEPSRLKSVLLSRKLLLFSASYFAFCYWMYLLESWSFYYYSEVRHFSPEDSAKYLSAMMITAALATPAGGWISDRLSILFGRSVGRRAVPVAGIALSVTFGALGGAGLPPLVTATGLAASYGFLNLCDPVFWAVTIESTGEHSGAACGLMNTGGNCAGILSPLVTPFIAVRFGWTAALYAGGAVALFALTPWLLARTLPTLHPTAALEAVRAIPT